MGWQDRARCYGTDSNMFMDELAEALLLCRKCPVQVPCLEYAINTDAQGIWGGTTAKQREVWRLRDSLLGGEIAIIWSVITD